MFFILPWRLRQSNEPRGVPAANLVIIALNVLVYLFGWYWPIGPGSRPLAILSYAFCHVGLWHLVFNMWALWVFGNPLNRRLGNCYYSLLYLGTAIVLGLVAWFVLRVYLVGASGALFAVIAAALLLMPASVLEVASVALFPLTLLVAAFSKPEQWWHWLVRAAILDIPALWALVVVIPLVQLFNYWWQGWNPGCLAHLLGMICGVAAVLLLPGSVTMRRKEALDF